jgi:hypothetical protein
MMCCISDRGPTIGFEPAFSVVHHNQIGPKKVPDRGRLATKLGWQLLVVVRAM